MENAAFVGSRSFAACAFAITSTEIRFAALNSFRNFCSDAKNQMMLRDASYLIWINDDGRAKFANAG
jgi:hypothetical protein